MPSKHTLVSKTQTIKFEEVHNHAVQVSPFEVLRIGRGVEEGRVSLRANVGLEIQVFLQAILCPLVSVLSMHVITDTHAEYVPDIQYRPAQKRPEVGLRLTFFF